MQDLTLCLPTDRLRPLPPSPPPLPGPAACGFEPSPTPLLSAWTTKIFQDAARVRKGARPFYTSGNVNACTCACCHAVEDDDFVHTVCCHRLSHLMQTTMLTLHSCCENLSATWAFPPACALHPPLPPETLGLPLQRARRFRPRSCR
jgi:hypothetical protein